MKKLFRYYAAAWLLCLVLFNVLTFVTPDETEHFVKFAGAFWFGYSFITLAFICQLAIAFKTFRGDAKKAFLNISLLSISFSMLAVCTAAGVFCLAVPFLPIWAAVVICSVVTAFYGVGVVKATAAVSLVSDKEREVKSRTFFIKNLTSSLSAMTVPDELRAKVDEVRVAARYSDPMSSPEIECYEMQIDDAEAALEKAIAEGNTDSAAESCDKILRLLKTRNEKCRLLK